MKRKSRMPGRSGVVAELSSTLSAIASAETNDFLKLAALAGLNPASDFVGADLRGCDLSGLDLSTFNLSGADLSGANLTGTTLPISAQLNQRSTEMTAASAAEILSRYDISNPLRYERLRALVDALSEAARQQMPEDFYEMLSRVSLMADKSILVQRFLKRVSQLELPKTRRVNALGMKIVEDAYRTMHTLERPAFIDVLGQSYRSNPFVRAYIENLARTARSARVRDAATNVVRSMTSKLDAIP